MESRGKKRAAGREMGGWKRRPQWVGRPGTTPRGKKVRRRKEARTHEWKACRRRTNRHWNLVSPTICWWFAGFRTMDLICRPPGLIGQRRFSHGSSNLVQCIDRGPAYVVDLCAGLIGLVGM